MNEIALLTIGWLGLAMSLVYRIPQIIKIVRTKSAQDISVWLIHIQNVSYILYIIYGVGRDDMIYIVSSALSLVQNLFIWYLRYLYKKKEPIKVEYGCVVAI